MVPDPGTNPFQGGKQFMGFTLHLEGPLAEALRQQALDEHTSVEEYALRLMADAVQERIAAKQWDSSNRRRLELIARKLQGPLTNEEEEEFQQLQALTAERAAPFDRVLLQAAADLRRAVEQLPEESAP
jgi:hypothetical protein